MIKNNKKLESSSLFIFSLRGTTPKIEFTGGGHYAQTHFTGAGQNSFLSRTCIDCEQKLMLFTFSAVKINSFSYYKWFSSKLAPRQKSSFCSRLEIIWRDVGKLMARGPGFPRGSTTKWRKHPAPRAGRYSSPFLGGQVRWWS